MISVEYAAVLSSADGIIHFPAPGPLLIDSPDAAAQMLCDYFLANADRGDNAANDELVTELVRRMRTEQECGVSASSPVTPEAAALRHRTRSVR